MATRGGDDSFCDTNRVARDQLGSFRLVCRRSGRDCLSHVRPHAVSVAAVNRCGCAPRHSLTEYHLGKRAIRATAKINIPIANRNDTPRTHRTSNLLAALAKKRTAAKRTVFAKYWA